MIKVYSNVIENKLRKMVKEEMLKEDSVSPSFRQMINAIENALSIIFNQNKQENVHFYSSKNK